MTSARTIAALAALLTSLAAPAFAQSAVTVSFPEPGRVTITARSAPLRTILAEWGRVGGSRFVNAERITGAPLTLELTNVTERKAIETLLRGVSGYIVGARAASVAGSSTFDRIVILPVAAPIRATAAAGPPPPVFSPTPAPFVPSEPDDNSENGTATGGRGGMPPTLLQQQLREATERAEAARQLRVREEEDDDAADDEPAAPAQRPGPSANPFGNVQGSSRPGEINAAPRRPGNRSPENER